LSTPSNLLFPNHYLEIIFRDLNINSIRIPNSNPGSSVPCTLSSLFLGIPARNQNEPQCIVHKLDTFHGTIIVRVQQIANLVVGTYQITLDDFLLPDLINPVL
jgi:hypothetical protein